MGKNLEAGPSEATPDFTETPYLMRAIEASPEVRVSNEVGTECSAEVCCGALILLGANPEDRQAVAASTSSRSRRDLILLIFLQFALLFVALLCIVLITYCIKK